MVYLLVALVPLLYLLNLGYFQVWSPNEAFYADATRAMVQSGNFIDPYYNGELRLNKPPMTYWLVAIGYYLLSINEWGLRLMHALLGLMTGIITFLIAKEITGNYKIGLFSFLMLTLSVQFFANSQYASPEVPFTFFITLSLYLWFISYKRKSLLLLFFTFLSSSCAMLVKGPAGFLLPAGIVFLYLLFTDPKELLKLKYYIFTAISLVLGLWWHVYELLTKGHTFWEVFYRENFKRVYDGKDPFYFYLLDLNVSFLPYSFLFFFAFLWVVLKIKREYAFPMVWFLFVYGIFSLVAQKIPVYVLPAFPALAIMTSGFMLSQDWERLKRYAILLLLSLISIALAVGIFLFSLPFAFLLIIPLPFLLFLKDHRLSPALAGMMFIVLLKFGLLTDLEEKRKVKELGEFIKKLDPKSAMPVYEVGHFHHSLPFYAERKIIRDKEPQKGSIVVYKSGTFEKCNPIKSLRLYTGSESRLFKFLMDARKNKNFEEFFVCLY
ncbi:MAG: glycosyltransferase family 39 protein [Aquificota bacterium]|nr:MAG: glycosyltransferase family 39 protein [Aquificota bacterium]